MYSEILAKESSGICQQPAYLHQSGHIGYCGWVGEMGKPGKFACHPSPSPTVHTWARDQKLEKREGGRRISVPAGTCQNLAQTPSGIDFRLARGLKVCRLRKLSFVKLPRPLVKLPPISRMAGPTHFSLYTVDYSLSLSPSHTQHLPFRPRLLTRPRLSALLMEKLFA